VEIQVMMPLMDSAGNPAPGSRECRIAGRDGRLM
jgi:hypothetical protein